MLFYERAPPGSSLQRQGSGGPMVPLVPLASSSSSVLGTTHVHTIELPKDLADWIWEDNMQFLQDKNIFEHSYFK